MALALTFLLHCENKGDKFLNHIVTDDETWILFTNMETKWQSMQWLHTGLPKPKKFKQTFSTQKLVTRVFCDCFGVLLVEFMEPGTTIMSAVYCEALNRLRRAIVNKRHGALTSGIVLLHDNA